MHTHYPTPIPVPHPVWSGVKEDAFRTMHLKQKSSLIGYRCKKYVELFTPESLRDLASDPCPASLLELFSCSDRSLLSRKQYRACSLHLCRVSHAPMFILEFEESRTQMADTEKGDPTFLESHRSALLTYNGDWGLVPCPSALRGGDIQVVVAFLQESKEVLSLWSQVTGFVEKHFLPMTTFNVWGAALEVCPTTWGEHGIIRLHVHVFIGSEDGHRNKRRISAEHIKLFGSRPHKVGALHCRKIRNNMAAGLFYVLAPKIGSIVSAGNRALNKDVPVDARWVFNLLEARKIEPTAAKEMIIKAVKGVPAKLKDLEGWKKASTELTLNAHIKARQERLALRRLPFKIIPAVQQWFQRYVAADTDHDRKKFLVLDGPSCVGKTAFVRSLFGKGEGLELNCAKAQECCLMSFDHNVHRCILWDEATPRLIVENRKVFQMPCTLVQLGQSATGSFEYSVWLNDSVSVIATNRWRRDLYTSLQPEDVDWIQANSVLVEVLEPLWA